MFIKFNIGCSTHVAFEFKAVVQSCHFFVRAIRFLVRNTSCSRARSTIYTRLTVTSNGNVSCYTVFTVDADFTVFAVCTGCSNCLYIKVFTKFHINCAVAVSVLRDFRNDIGVIPFNCYFGAQFICFFTAVISVEFQAFINKILFSCINFIV